MKQALLVLSAFSLLIGIPLTIKYLLGSEKRDQHNRDIGPPG